VVTPNGVGSGTTLHFSGSAAVTEFEQLRPYFESVHWFVHFCVPSFSCSHTSTEEVKPQPPPASLSDGKLAGGMFAGIGTGFLFVGRSS
jgi:hypothetical protein